MSKKNVDLSLLKRLVAELEASLNAADGIKTGAKADKTDWTVELTKATGLAAGVMTEAGMLVVDIQHEIQGTPAAGDTSNILKQLMGGFKGPSNAN